MSEFIININESEIKVNISSDKEVFVNDSEINYEMIEIENNSYILRLNNKQYQVDLVGKNKDSYELLINNVQVNSITRSALEHRAMKLIEQANVKSQHHTEMKAPMPGMILKIKKQPGDKITKGESILILEAMKMENDIKSPATGTIKEINITEGNAVEKGAKLFSIE